jgi:hypothetical protein
MGHYGLRVTEEARAFLGFSSDRQVKTMPRTRAESQ